MSVPNSSVAVTGLTLGTILTAAPFGVPVETIAIGTLFSVLGVMGRAAFELQKVAEGGAGMTVGRVLGWFGAGLLGAPFMTVTVIALLKFVGVQIDIYSVIGFLAAGFFGPRFVGGVIQFGTDYLRKRFGAAIIPGTIPGSTNAQP